MPSYTFFMKKPRFFFATSNKRRNFASDFTQISSGEMVEWSITAVLKTAELRGSRGSNPCLSAKPADFSRFFVFQN